MSFYEPGTPLDRVIDEAINAFAAERQVYWEEDEEGRKAFELADGLAQLLLEPSDDLTTARSAETWVAIRGLSKDIRPGDAGYEALELLIADKFLPTIAQMASRCLDLSAMVLSHEPNEAVRRFLARVARCYVFGFVPECGVMCRATVENGLKERFARADLPLPATAKGRSDMRTRLDAAV